MAGTQPYLLGRHLTSVVVKGMTRADDGTLSIAVSKTVSVLTTELDFQSDPTHEDIGPVNVTGANNVITTDDSTLNLTVLLLANGENALASLFYTYDFFEVLWTRGGQGYDYICTRGAFGDTINSRGANFQRTTFRRVEIGTANPLYA